MRRIDAGISGIKQQKVLPLWEERFLDRSWQGIINALNVGHAPRLIQLEALKKYKILEHRRNLLVSAPTNSGKSLIGLLVLLEAVRQGRRAVLLEPLRAIAQEKVDELESLASGLSQALGRSFSVRITTGDYRLEDETFASPPPQTGELIIATPERFDAILRRPEYNEWVSSVAAVCVDEAHMISSAKRGPVLEYLLTFLLSVPAPPRLVLLSATLGNVDRALEWLAPCDLIRTTDRYPHLRQEVWEIAPNEDANEMVTAFAQEVLCDSSANILVFVYQTKSAERLAGILRSSLGGDDTSKVVLAYHAQMIRSQRDFVRQSFMTGECRCVVTTTALGLGVNLPATHVLVRDCTFAGVGPLNVSDLIQMMGRAGRGEQAGYAAVIVRPNDAWKADELARELHDQKLPDLVSSFDRPKFGTKQYAKPPSTDTVTVATHIAAQISRRPETGLCVNELETFFERSLGGNKLASHVRGALSWLSDTSRVLAFLDESGRYRLTALGLASIRAILPLEVAAGFAQLVKDLLSVDPSDRLLAKWRPLDHLLVLDLLFGRSPHLRSFSEKLAEQVDAWMEASPEHTPMLYREWIAGESGTSRSVEVLGSLGLTLSDKNSTAADWAHRSAYLALFRTILLHEQSEGTSVEDLKRRWGVSNFEGVEERWRDNLLWLLSGLVNILELRCFYYHLREECKADKERVQRVKRLLHKMRMQIFHLRESLKYCSPLGPVLLSIRRSSQPFTGTSVGLQSIRRLEGAGINNFVELARFQVKDMVQLGVRTDLAKQIRNYIRRRLQ